MKLPSKNPRNSTFASKGRIVGLIGKLKLPEVARPNYADTLCFPEDITALTAQNISELLGKYTLLYSYVNQELAAINRAIMRCESQIILRRNNMLKERPSLNTVDKNKRDAIYASDHFVEATTFSRRAKEMDRIEAEMFLSNYDRYVVALSRELTRKSTEESQGYRVNLRQR